MPGYSTSVCITESGLYLRVALKSKFINGKTCFEKILEMQKKYKNGDFMREVSSYFKDYSVMSTYGNYKVYKIDYVAFDLNVTNKTINFRSKDGIIHEITLQQYYAENYQKKIKNPDQPLFVSSRKNSKGENDPIYLVPELCFLTGLDEEQINEESLKKNMTNKTKLNARDRMEKIKEIKHLIYKNNSQKRQRVNKQTQEMYSLADPNEIREMWGLNVGDFKEFIGRTLIAPDIRFKDSNIFLKVAMCSINNGKFRGGALFEGIDLTPNNWAIVCSRANADSADSCLRSFQAASGKMGIRIEKPQRCNLIQARNIEEWTDRIRELSFPNNIKIVLVILDRNTKHIYTIIKQHLYSAIGIPVQVVLKENLSKNLSYFSNVLNQMVVKMGGKLYSIDLDKKLSDNV
jgi:aubergine-like protein